MKYLAVLHWVYQLGGDCAALVRRAQGYPMPDIASSKWLQPAHHTAQGTAEPLGQGGGAQGNTCLRKYIMLPTRNKGGKNQLKPL